MAWKFRLQVSKEINFLICRPIVKARFYIHPCKYRCSSYPFMIPLNCAKTIISYESVCHIIHIDLDIKIQSVKWILNIDQKLARLEISACSDANSSWFGDYSNTLLIHQIWLHPIVPFLNYKSKSGARSCPDLVGW